MTIQMIANETDARTVLSETTERQAIRAAVYLIMPTDGSPIDNSDIVDFVHSVVDPIHSLLRNPSKSYTDVSSNGTRTKAAIQGAIQWFGPGSGKGGHGRNWIALDNGQRYYQDNGADKAHEYYQQPEQQNLLMALDIMGEIVPYDPADDAEPIADDLTQIAAQDVTDKPKAVLSERAAESERLVQQAIAERDAQLDLTGMSSAEALAATEQADEDDPSIEDMKRQIAALEERIRNVTVAPFTNRDGMLQDHIDDLFHEQAERMSRATTMDEAEQHCKGLRHAIIQLVTDDLNAGIDEWIARDR